MPVEGQARKQNAYILVCDCQCSINKKQLDIRRNWFKLFRTKKKINNNGDNTKQKKIN